MKLILALVAIAIVLTSATALPVPVGLATTPTAPRDVKGEADALPDLAQRMLSRRPNQADGAPLRRGDCKSCMLAVEQSAPRRPTAAASARPLGTDITAPRPSTAGVVAGGAGGEARTSQQQANAPPAYNLGRFNMQQTRLGPPRRPPQQLRLPEKRTAQSVPGSSDPDM